MSQILLDNSGRRMGIERRQFSYTAHIPERRSGKERRTGLDRRLNPRLHRKSEKIGKDQTVYLKPALKLEFGQNDLPPAGSWPTHGFLYMW